MVFSAVHTFDACLMLKSYQLCN